ncbi:MAG: DUF5916 domain-containing protein [Gemmatimonadetes bacterium]|nr:DUF5916 domain-containing protein [Gemmatimonadota bacterium]
MHSWIRVVPRLVVLALAFVQPAKAQDSGDGGTRSNPPARAVARSGDIRIDGRLDESAWRSAPAASGFVQREPVEGAVAEEDTEVRVLFDASSVYVGARMHDSRPAQIADQLVRRDGRGQYDYFEVAFDPNLDRRTGYSFRVSAANVQRDVYLFEDNEDDEAWDAVWTSAVQRDSLGWTVEMRIPLSQMRYKASDSMQTWGVNFVRRRLQTNEETHYALISQLQQGRVSQFATLEGMQITRAARLLEFLPYALSSAYTAPSVPSDPFFDGSELDSRVGIDVRYGIGAQFTLDATINPDFGQVEADPAVINLTAFETRFDERRPFFVEDAQIFDFSLSAGQDLYYSRRIGRPPHGRPPSGSEFATIPSAATIVGATKLTGRTTGGLSVGGLVAFTREESGRSVDEATGAIESFRVEPRTGYGVARLQQDFNDGTSTLGAIGTVLRRNLPGDNTFDFLPRTAISAAIDFEYGWSDRAWAVFGYFSASRVEGDSTAMIRIQRSSNHFFQRPDARRLRVDSTATSLTGVDWRLTLARRRGEHWTGSIWLAETTPQFEINDLGFSRRQEALDGGARVEYQEIRPGPLLRGYNATFSTFHNFSHDALEDPWSFRSWQRAHVSGSFNLSTEIELLNYWQIEADLRLRPQQMDRTATRGGPLMMAPRSQSVAVEIKTDRRNRFNAGFSVDHEWIQLNGGSSLELGLEMEFRPSPLVQLEVEPQFSISSTASQYVATTAVNPYSPTFGSRYLFGDLERRELSLETRLDVVFSPTLSLQVFAQPLLSSGDYVSYKQLLAPETFDFDVFAEGTYERAGQVDVCVGGRTCVEKNGRRHIDFDGDGISEYSFDDRDFNVRSLIGNIVLRWEYRPGSTVFLVWQRSQEDEQGIGDFEFGRDLRALINAPAQNAFMIKVNYWFAMP